MSCFQSYWSYVVFSRLRSANDGSFELRGWELCFFPTEMVKELVWCSVQQCLMLVLELPLKLSCIITPESLRRTWLMNCYCLSLHTNLCWVIHPDRTPEREKEGFSKVHHFVMRYERFYSFEDCNTFGTTMVFNMYLSYGISWLFDLKPSVGVSLYLKCSFSDICVLATQ